MNTVAAEERCRLCHSERVFVLSHNLLRCQDCQFLFLDQATLAEQQASYHAQSEQGVDADLLVRLKNKYPKDHHDKRALYVRIAKRVLGWYGETVRVLDVGASGGFFLHAVEAAGAMAANLETNEVSPTYVQLTSDYFGYDGGVGNIERYAPGKKYDLVTMFDVLEHVDDFEAALLNIHGLLRPGGRLLLKLPNGNFAYLKYRLAHLFGRARQIPLYLHLRPGGHLNYWNKSNIARIEGERFMIDSFEYVSPTKEQFGNKALLRSFFHWLDGLLGANLFPEMIVVLKKID